MFKRRLSLVLFMRHQYYTDSRDVAKWTALVRLAQEYSLDTIMHIAMLTPDDVSSHGGQRNDPPDADAEVARFFMEEREAISGDASLKQIDRVGRLGTRFTPPITILVITSLFRNSRREIYFDALCEKISSIERPIVAFVDPDIGISIGRPSDGHITEKELSSIWSNLKRGSLLVAFQYQQRRKEWINDSCQRLASALQAALGEVGAHSYPRVFVSFIFARKSQ